MYYHWWILLMACGVLFTGSERARADLFLPSSSVNFTGDDDPNGGSYNSTVSLSSLLAGTTIDGGLLNASATITPVNSSSAWIQFNLTTVSGGQLAGSPGGSWDFHVNFSAAAPAADPEFFLYFPTTSGGTTYFPFPGGTPVTNPITGSGTVLLGVNNPPYVYSTSESLFANIGPFNESPTFFETGNPSQTPNGLSFAGLYVLQSPPAVPEASSLVLLAIAAVLGIPGCLLHRARTRTAALAT